MLFLFLVEKRAPKGPLDAHKEKLERKAVLNLLPQRGQNILNVVVESL